MTHNNIRVRITKQERWPVYEVEALEDGCLWGKLCDLDKDIIKRYIENEIEREKLQDILKAAYGNGVYDDE